MTQTNLENSGYEVLRSSKEKADGMSFHGAAGARCDMKRPRNKLVMGDGQALDVKETAGKWMVQTKLKNIGFKVFKSHKEKMSDKTFHSDTAARCDGKSQRENKKKTKKPFMNLLKFWG